MAGVIPGFDAVGFRTGIRLAMTMSLPNDPLRQPRFVIAGALTPSPTHDSEGVPWDIEQDMAAPTDTGVRVPCAIQWTERSEDTRMFGPLQPGQVEITLLDEEYAQVEGFTYVELWPTLTKGPVRYFYRRVLLQTNLDTVGVWTLECATEDMV